MSVMQITELKISAIEASLEKLRKLTGATDETIDDMFQILHEFAFDKTTNAEESKKKLLLRIGDDDAGMKRLLKAARTDGGSR